MCGGRKVADRCIKGEIRDSQGEEDSFYQLLALRYETSTWRGEKALGVMGNHQLTARRKQVSWSYNLEELDLANNQKSQEVDFSQNLWIQTQPTEIFILALWNSEQRNQQRTPGLFTYKTEIIFFYAFKMLS